MDRFAMKEVWTDNGRYYFNDSMNGVIKFFKLFRVHKAKTTSLSF